MDHEVSNDGLQSEGSRAPGALAIMCTEDTGNLSTCFFDGADDEDFQGLSSPPYTQGFKPRFPNFAMKYHGKKTEDTEEDMEAYHSDLMTQLELPHAPDLTEYENSQSFDGTFFQRRFTEQVQNTEDSIAQAVLPGQSPSAGVPIPGANRLPAEYQNSKILQSYYAQVGGMAYNDKSGGSSVASSPAKHPRESSVSPCASPQPERKKLKSKVKNRDVNVWAPGST